MIDEITSEKVLFWMRRVRSQRDQKALIEATKKIKSRRPIPEAEKKHGTNANTVAIHVCQEGVQPMARAVQGV